MFTSPIITLSGPSDADNKHDNNTNTQTNTNAVDPVHVIDPAQIAALASDQVKLRHYCKVLHTGTESQKDPNASQSDTSQPQYSLQYFTAPQVASIYQFPTG